MSRPALRWPVALVACALVGLGRCAAHAADPYSIAPATPARVLDARWFATHLHRLIAEPRPGARATPWPTVQLGALRLWDSGTGWADLEPARGTFHFERLDAYLALAQAHGAAPLMVLGLTPRWASARPDEPAPYGPGGAAEPASLDDWDRYVTAVVRRCKGRVTEYELWNEPYFSDLPADRGRASAFFSGSVASMVELARRARAVLDREDPSAVLLTPGFVGDVQRFEMFLNAGGGRHVGGVAYHFYAGSEPDFIRLHHDVRAVMARHGLAGLPLYDTENGFAARDDNAGPDRSAAAALLARSMVLGAFLGIDRFYHYAWDNGVSGMLWPRTSQPTPSLVAFDAVRRWLVGTQLQACRLDDGVLVRCEGTRDGDQISIAWLAADSGAATLRLPAAAQLLSLEHALDPAGSSAARPARAPIVVAGVAPVAVWWRAPNGVVKP